MRKKSLTPIVIAAIMGLLGFTSLGHARNQVQVVGSSTVLPYAKIVAEEFGESWDEFKTPVIESGGSGAGIKEFCRGIGADRIDVVNASRPMKSSELQSCLDAGVTQVQEIRFGYDGIVLAGDVNGPDWHFKPQDIYRALAAQIVVEGRLVANKTNSWHQIDEQFPSTDILLYLPGEKHGSREVVEKKLMQAGCKASGAMDALKKAGLDDKAINAACVAVRKDGKAVDIDGDYAEILAHIKADKNGIGTFGLSFYENNADKLKVATINGIAPSGQTIAGGNYSLSRPLYFYVKQAHLDLVPGLREYVEFFLSEQMIGPDGPLADYGLVPAPDSERQGQRDAFAKAQIMLLE